VLLQAGNVAGVSGEIEQARTLFGKAAKLAPDSPAGRAAAAALAANAGEVESAAPVQAKSGSPQTRSP
jgi:hypothetical protein